MNRDSLQKNRGVLRLLFLIFLISLLALNWSDIYWIFNPRVISFGIQSVVGRNESINETYYQEVDSINIPLINISAPIVESKGSSDRDFAEALDRGVVHFPESAIPGEIGTAILLGHSAPAGWPKINYDWVFSEIEKLNEGDKIEIYFNKRKYIYKVKEKIFLEIGEDLPSYASDKSEIVLLSCWPPGRNIKRIGVRAILE